VCMVGWGRGQVGGGGVSSTEDVELLQPLYCTSVPVAFVLVAENAVMVAICQADVPRDTPTRSVLSDSVLPTNEYTPYIVGTPGRETYRSCEGV